MILQTFSTIALPLILPTCVEAIRCKDCGELHYPKQAWLHAACAFGSKGLPVFRDAAGVKRDGLFKYSSHRVTDGVLDSVTVTKTVTERNEIVTADRNETVTNEQIVTESNGQTVTRNENRNALSNAERQKRHRLAQKISKSS